MKKISYQNFFGVPIIVLVAVLFFSGMNRTGYARDYEDRITKSFRVREGQTFYLKSDMGSVDVSSWNRREVKIIITKTAKTSSRREASRAFDDLEIRFENNRGGVSVYAEYIGPKRWFSGRAKLRVHFDVMVPRVFNLDVNTSGAVFVWKTWKGKSIFTPPVVR